MIGKEYSISEVEEDSNYITGRVGDIVENLSSEKRQTVLFSNKLEVEKVFSNFAKISGMEG